MTCNKEFELEFAYCASLVSTDVMLLVTVVSSNAKLLLMIAMSYLSSCITLLIFAISMSFGTMIVIPCS